MEDENLTTRLSIKQSKEPKVFTDLHCSVGYLQQYFSVFAARRYTDVPVLFFACSAVLDRVFDKGLQRQGGDRKIGIFYIEDNVQIFFAADVFKVRKHPYVIQFFFERYKIGSRSFDLRAQMF